MDDTPITNHTLLENGEDKEKKELYNILLYSIGKLISLLGTSIYSFAISLYILKVTGSGTSFALSILLGSLPRVILSPIAGSVSDRVNRKKMTIFLDILSGIIVLMLFASSLLYGLLLPLIYITNFLLAVIGTFFYTCFSAALPRLVRDHKLVKINSYSRAIDSGSSVLGPVLAGMVFGLVPMNLFLIVNGISFLLSAVSEVFMDFEFNKSQKEQKLSGNVSIKTIGQDIREVSSFIRGNKLLTLIIPFSITINFLIAASMSVVLPYLINKVLGMTSAQYGIIEGAFSVGMLIAALVVGRLPEKEKKRGGFILGIIGTGITMFIMGLPGTGILRGLSINIIFILYIIMGMLFAYFLLSVDLPLNVVLQRSIPNQMMGRFMGVIGTISSSLSPLGIILAGITLDIIPAYIIFFTGGLYLSLAALIMLKSKAMKEY